MVEATLFVLVVALLVLIALQVFTRYVLHSAVPWTEEVARMLIVWTVMLGAAVAMDRKEHYAITFLSNRLTGTVKIGLLIVTDIIGLVFLGALTIYDIEYVRTNIDTVFVSTGIRRSWVYLALPTGAAIMALSLVVNSIEVLFNNDGNSANRSRLLE
jgi:TRAP-type C4-dicarboxylate transport system permease small subunit